MCFTPTGLRENSFLMNFSVILMYSLYTAGASPLTLIRVAIASKIIRLALEIKI
jgi:hypothetical protein